MMIGDADLGLGTLIVPRLVCARYLGVELRVNCKARQIEGKGQGWREKEQAGRG